MIRRPQAFLDVNRACAGLLLRIGLDSTPRGEVQPDRFPCGKLRTGPRIVRIRRTELSRNRK